MDKSFSATVFMNSFFMLAGQVTLKIISFIFSVLVIRKLGAEVYGQYAAILAFGAVFAIFSDLGMSPYSTREVARLRVQSKDLSGIEKIFSNVLVLRLWLTLATSVLIICFAWLSKRPLVMVGAIALNTIGLFLYSIQGTAEAVLAGYEKLSQVSLTKVVNQIVFVFLGSIALIGGLGYYGLIIANLISIAIMTLLCWRLIKAIGINLVRIDQRIWLPYIKSSLPFGLIGLALGLSYKFDTLLLNIFRSNTETGNYNAAYNLVFSAILLSNVINTALYPSLTKKIVSSPESLLPIFQRVFKYLLMLSFPISLGGWILAEPILNFLYGSEYAGSIVAFKIVIWVVPIMYLSEFLGYVVVIQNKEKSVARAVFISTGFNVILNSLLIPRFGLIAAAIMTVCTEVILVLQHLWNLRNYVIKTDWTQILLRPLVAVVIMGVLIYFIKDRFHFSIDILIGAVIFVLASLIMKVIGKEEVSFLLGMLISKWSLPKGENL